MDLFIMNVTILLIFQQLNFLFPYHSSHSKPHPPCHSPSLWGGNELCSNFFDCFSQIKSLANTVIWFIGPLMANGNCGVYISITYFQATGLTRGPIATSPAACTLLSATCHVSLWGFGVRSGRRETGRQGHGMRGPRATYCHTSPISNIPQTEPLFFSLFQGKVDQIYLSV